MFVNWLLVLLNYSKGFNCGDVCLFVARLRFRLWREKQRNAESGLRNGMNIALYISETYIQDLP